MVLNINELLPPLAHVTFDIGTIFIQGKSVGIIKDDQLIFFKLYDTHEDADAHFWVLRKRYGTV